MKETMNMSSPIETTAKTPRRTRTAQYFYSRVVHGPQAKDASLDFVRLAAEQTGVELRTIAASDSDHVTIDMEAWPEGEAIEWLDDWAQRWNLIVED